MFKKDMWKIVRGDMVAVLSGKEKGAQGIVREVIRDKKFPRVVVEGLNKTTRHVKNTGRPEGGIISVESPIHYSNVALVDPVTNEAVRAEWVWLEDGTPVRQSRGKKASKTIIPRPQFKITRKPRPRGLGPKDTSLADVRRVTYTEDDEPTVIDFQQGIFPWTRKARAAAEPGDPSSDPSSPKLSSTAADGHRSYSTTAAGGGRSTPQLRSSGMLAVRQPNSLWRGFAASALWR